MDGDVSEVQRLCSRRLDHVCSHDLDDFDLCCLYDRILIARDHFFFCRSTDVFWCNLISIDQYLSEDK
jgi:hypothetical protein